MNEDLIERNGTNLNRSIWLKDCVYHVTPSFVRLSLKI